MKTECIVAFGQDVPTVMDSRGISRYGGTSRPNIYALDRFGALSQAVRDDSTVPMVSGLTSEQPITTFCKLRRAGSFYFMVWQC